MADSMHLCPIETHHRSAPLAPGRREWMRLSVRVASLAAAAGCLPSALQAQSVEWNKAAFDARVLADAVKALGSAAPVESREISMTAPDIAENGAIVPIGITTGLTGVARLLVLVEKNPAPLAAVFTLSDAVEANLNARIKMNQSSWVYAVALMADGRTLFTRKDVKVTLGGCGV